MGQTSFERETLSIIMTKYDELKTKSDDAALYNNDRLFVIKQKQFIAYCNDLVQSNEISDDQKQNINQLSEMVADILIPLR